MPRKMTLPDLRIAGKRAQLGTRWSEHWGLASKRRRWTYIIVASLVGCWTITPVVTLAIGVIVWAVQDGKTNGWGARESAKQAALVVFAVAGTAAAFALGTISGLGGMGRRYGRRR
jgi:hypothetical protein